jgi:RimJ/RimL family protein N-acetyltransferase
MNIKFKLVELADLELLRTHRNHPLTRKWLEFEGLVSSEEQIAWFKSGQSMSFRIIQKDSTKIGLARIKDMSDQFIQIGMDLFIEFRGKRFASSIFKGLVEEVKNNKKDLELWVFLDNEIAVKTYINAGFEFDTSTSVKFFMRSWDHTSKLYPYARMILSKV